jgi:Ulp1 family protease
MRRLPKQKDLLLLIIKQTMAKYCITKYMVLKQKYQQAKVTHLDCKIHTSEAYFQGAEILVNIIGVSDFDVAIPTEQGDFVVEQYGYDVNMGEIIYQRESQYASRIPQGIIIRNTYTNDTDSTLEVGVNFIMHEIREPE